MEQKQTTIEETKEESNYLQRIEELEKECFQLATHQCRLPASSLEGTPLCGDNEAGKEIIKLRNKVNRLKEYIRLIENKLKQSLARGKLSA